MNRRKLRFRRSYKKLPSRNIDMEAQNTFCRRTVVYMETLFKVARYSGGG